MTNPRGAAAGTATDPQQPALLARQDQVRAAVERCAVEVVRKWLIERERTWLAVEFTTTLPEPYAPGHQHIDHAPAGHPFKHGEAR